MVSKGTPAKMQEPKARKRTSMMAWGTTLTVAWALVQKKHCGATMELAKSFLLAGKRAVLLSLGAKSETNFRTFGATAEENCEMDAVVSSLCNCFRTHLTCDPKPVLSKFAADCGGSFPYMAWFMRTDCASARLTKPNTSDSWAFACASMALKSGRT
eukprot:11705658-Alexandrium_andersonii.AAC.1